MSKTVAALAALAAAYKFKSAKPLIGAAAVYVLHKLASKNKHDPLKRLPDAGWWYLWLLATNTKKAEKTLYDYYCKERGHKAIKCKGLSFTDEVILFDFKDVQHAHRNEGSQVCGAGDLLFERLTHYYQNKYGETSHGANMFWHGPEHEDSRKLSNDTEMKCHPFVYQTAAKCVSHYENYSENVLLWIQRAYIDVFFALMVSRSPGCSDPESTHPLRHLPADDHKAFVWGLILSVFPRLTFMMENEFRRAIDNITDLGVAEVEEFLKIPVEDRPPGYVASLLKHASPQDAKELLSLFTTAFQGNISLTTHMIVYHLANDTKTQDALHEEISSMKGYDDIMKESMPLLEAIQKESHRITPITAYTQIRKFANDIDLPSSGVTIPANTIVMCMNKLSMRDEDLVPHANEFKPERYWKKTLLDEDQNLHAFVQRSEFGSNSRSCLGRRSAKCMMRTVIVELFRTYRTCVCVDIDILKFPYS